MLYIPLFSPLSPIYGTKLPKHRRFSFCYFPRIPRFTTVANLATVASGWSSPVLKMLANTAIKYRGIVVNRCKITKNIWIIGSFCTEKYQKTHIFEPIRQKRPFDKIKKRKTSLHTFLPYHTIYQRIQVLLIVFFPSAADGEDRWDNIDVLHLLQHAAYRFACRGCPGAVLHYTYPTRLVALDA